MCMSFIIHVTSSPLCTLVEENKRSLIGPFVRPPEIEHCSIVNNAVSLEIGCRPSISKLLFHYHSIPMIFVSEKPQKWSVKQSTVLYCVVSYHIIKI